MSDKSELPPGWAAIRLGDCATKITKGSTPTSYGHQYQSSGIPFVRIENLRDGVIDQASISAFIDDAANETLKRSKLEAGDLLLSIAGTIGKSAIVSETDVPANTNQALAIIRGTGKAFEPDFLRFTLASNDAQNQAKRGQRGGALQNISLDDVKNLTISIPPMNEQRRIVAKIEDLTARSRAAKQALDAIPPLLERFRQSVLAAAFRGDLTKQWRQQNPNVEPASVLLKRIRQERRHRWEQDYLDQQKAKGKTPKDDKWKEKYQEPDPVDPTGLPELPEGWCWASVGNLCQGKIQTGPFGALLHNSEFTTNGVPVVAIGNVKWGHLDLNNVDYVTPEKAQMLDKFRIRTDDVLFTRSGTVGRSAIVPEACDGFVMSSHILRIRQSPRFYHPTLMFQAFRGEPTILTQLQELTRGATRPGFNTTLLSQMLIPVPPRSEQDAIVQALAGYSERIESFKSTTSLSENLDRLNQSILAKAFRGELVPQDPNDEPASVLLERIRAERESTTSAGNGKKRKARS